MSPDCPVLRSLRNWSKQHLSTYIGRRSAFDIDGDGVAEQMAWTFADAEIAFLAPTATATVHQ
jgi:hypothetical protein